MLNSKSIQSVIRLAGKVEAPPSTIPPSGAAPEEAKPAPEETTKQDQSYVLYAYYADEDKAINFPTIQQDLTKWRAKNDPATRAASQALLEKLRSEVGGAGPFTAAYFSWRKVFVVTNKYGGAYICYSAGITAAGTIDPGQEKIEPDTGAVTAEMIRETFNVIVNGRLNIQTNVPEYGVFFGNEWQKGGQSKPFTSNELLRTPGNPPANRTESYDGFSKKMDLYRIWADGKLVRPDFKESVNDGVPNKRYRGGDEAFKKVILPMAQGLDVEQEAPKAPPPPGAEKPEEESRFQAVDEPTKEPSEEPAGGPKMASEESTKGDYSSEMYSGGFDIMKRLFWDQHRCMKVRKCAKSVVLAYLKDADFTPTQTMQQTTSTPGQSQGVKLTMPDDETKGKAKVNKYYQEMKNLKNKLDRSVL
jgi:hypothetical protein